jgi:hypothetical protein
MSRQLLILVLLVGASAGVSGFILGRHSPTRRVTDIPTRQETLDAMADEVGLDASQRSRIREISDRYQDRNTALRRTVADEVATIRSSVRADTRAIMSDEQKHRFDAYCKRRDEQRARADQ